ncbi:bleomycin resistance protein [Streptomyces deccanensis]|uniref:bleomycin resistance protein n=1 Tax=Streptomyces deccanensis TaxID=424188 RepID=UPI001EFB8938|nr:VOC family protein [Streptomyces deccanensis]ULR50540.1 VOC family protein [Streptomyces deccanensis]
MGEKTIPILPCQSLEPLLDFYTALGFEVTFEQRSPNPYAVVERGGVELQFFGLKTYEPTASVSTCYVVTDDVDGLYAAFRAGLKRAYGRVPTRGLPRIGPLKDMSYGMRQFLMTDPGGNCVRVGQPTSEDQHHRPAPRETYARALHHASLLADSRDDPAAAAKVIDRVLGPETDGPDGPDGSDGPAPTASQLVRLLVLRADVAARTGDEETAADAIRRAGAVPLTDEEREEVRDSLVRLEDLRGRERA